jgi:large subunit ribosomal protein L22
MKAYLTNFKKSPRKVRLVADLVKGKNVSEAVLILKNVVKSASDPLAKLLNSAISNAKTTGHEVSNLFVKDFQVNGGVVMKRSMPRARGSAYMIKKRTSNVSLILEEKK